MNPNPIHEAPYPEAQAVTIARLQEGLHSLRREMEINLVGRDLAVERLEQENRDWKASANEWRGTVGDVTQEVKDYSRETAEQKVAAMREYVDGRFLTIVKGTDDLRAYVDQQVAQEREYIDGQFRSVVVARRADRTFAIGAIGVATAVTSTVVIIANYLGSL